MKERKKKKQINTKSISRVHYLYNIILGCTNSGVRFLVVAWGQQLIGSSVVYMLTCTNTLARIIHMYQEPEVEGSQP